MSYSVSLVITLSVFGTFEGCTSPQETSLANRKFHLNSNCYFLYCCCRCPPGVTGNRCQYIGKACKNGTLACLDGSGKCADYDSVCDGKNDCSNGLDETRSSCCNIKNKTCGEYHSYFTSKCTNLIPRVAIVEGSR